MDGKIAFMAKSHPTSAEIWERTMINLNEGEPHPEDICVVHTWESLLRGSKVNLNDEIVGLRTQRYQQLIKIRQGVIHHLDRKIGVHSDLPVNEFSRLMYDKMKNTIGAKIRWDNQLVSRMYREHFDSLRQRKMIDQNLELRFQSGGLQDAQNLAQDGKQVGVFFLYRDNGRPLFHAFHLRPTSKGWEDASDAVDSPIHKFVSSLIRSNHDLDQAMQEPIQRARGWNIVTLGEMIQSR